MEFDDIINEFTGAGTQRAECLDILLVRCMVNERMSPEILPFETELLQEVLKKLELQQQWLLDCHELNSGDSDFKLQLMIAETEIERLNYLVRMYLRTRLAKLDKFPAYYLGENRLLLSENELDYIKQHFRILTRLYTDSFLKKMPPSLALIDDTRGGEQMVETPDLDQPVFFQYLGEKGVEVDLGGDDFIDLQKGGIYVVRYSAIKRFLATDDIILI